MKKVYIEPGCISCGSCQFTAPEVFEVDQVSSVKKDADIKKYQDKIKQAARRCPVQVIKYEEE